MSYSTISLVTIIVVMFLAFSSNQTTPDQTTNQQPRSKQTHKQYYNQATQPTKPSNKIHTQPTKKKLISKQATKPINQSSEFWRQTTETHDSKEGVARRGISSLWVTTLRYGRTRRFQCDIKPR